MLRTLTFVLVLASVLFLGDFVRAVEEPSPSAFESENSDYALNDEAPAKTKTLKVAIKSTKKSFNKNVKDAGDCPPRPDVPINGDLSCSQNGCQATCIEGYRFPDGERKIAFVCREKEWKIKGTDSKYIPHCEPICLPECKNNGICVAPNQCSCSENFSGAQCQFENKPCLNPPPLTNNAQRKCNSKTCTVSCLNHFVFPDGSSVANLICKHGNWEPTRSDWVTIPDCQPVCDPACQNGGVCLSLNTCQCPPDYRGAQCQYPADSCSAEKLGFNGGYQCASPDEESYVCSLSCPSGWRFEFAPAASYECRYASGRFEPQPVPRCLAAPLPGTIQQSTVIWQTSNRSWSLQQDASYHRETLGSSTVFAHYDHMAGGFSASSRGTGSEKVKADKGLAHLGHEGSDNELTQTVKVQRNPEPGSCFTWAGAHYKSFDGQVYSFESSCTYALLKDSEEGLFTVAVQNEPGCGYGGRCARILRIFIQGKEYALLPGRNGSAEVRAGLTGKPIAVPAQLAHLRLEPGPGAQLVASLDALGLRIRWDVTGLVQIEASQALWNRTAGLCGSLNADRSDDLTGKSAAGRWKIQDIGEKCEEPTSHGPKCAPGSELERKASEFCGRLLAEPRYRRCAELVELAEFEAACRWDYCSCPPGERERCACDTMNVYVRQCAHKGLARLAGWRNGSLCPMQCSDGKVYSGCGPRSQPVCGDELGPGEPSSPANHEAEDCEEGCFCPAGSALHEGRCLAAADCPCRLRGKSFPAGASVTKDCNACGCAAGRWQCTESQCGARCSAVGDPHYTTFDGKRYDFMGGCSYYLVKADNYSVEAENAACPSLISEMMGLARARRDGEPTCTKTVTIRLSGVEVKLKQNRQVVVNGEEVTRLPTLAAGAKLRVVSSIFVSVELPNGLEVLWDGVSRVYVNAPAHFRGKTKGLCGTFTANQKDDFLTPDGDVEQSVVAFANKWKTSEQCFDVKKDSEHPCDLNPQKRAAAEKYCSILKKKPFVECHWHVDPEPFYRDCVYDMCACETSVEVCLCPALSAYAKDCGQQGVVTPWREEVSECRLHCPGDQEYQMCGSSCSRSCADISFQHGQCREECVEGCNCPRGYALNDRAECIPVGQCPCSHAGLEFPAGYREVRPGTKTQELCSCAGGLWNCRPATDEEIREYPPAAQLKGRCSDAGHQELTTCEPAEPRTCRNMHRPLDHSPAICRPGCVCKTGYVLDLPSGQCVRERDCPCYHGGRSYKEGSSMQEECNTCTCQAGKWNCTDIICPGVCSVWGDSHYKTFDDREYDFQGVCDYVLAKGKLSETESFEVTIRNVACGTTGVTCSKSITLTVGKSNTAQQESVSLTRGKTLTPESFKGLERIAARRAGLFLFLDVPDLGLVLQWDEGTRVYLRVAARWKGRVRGLCGDFDDDAANDFKTPAGGLAEASAGLFADSWKLGERCAEPADRQPDTCARRPERKLWATQRCRAIKSPAFAACHAEVPPDGYIERCILDACGCDDGGDCECLCTAIAAYAHECNARGVPVQWRSQKLCPLQCDESCSSYSSCVSTCPRESCDNLLTLADGMHLCEQDTCVEGCLPKGCPEGQVYLNASHAECVPRAECRSPCRVVDGTSYYEGERISGDGCHSCFCSRGKIVCSGKPCAVVVIPQVAAGDEKKKCKSGWTKWFNRDFMKQPGLRSDIEELPSLIEMLNDEGSPACEKGQMVDIKCRTADTKLSHKQVGLNVDCSLDVGLICHPGKDERENCPDFEISVLCQCEEASTSPGSVDECSLHEPHRVAPADCRDFLQCGPGLSGNVWLRKRCGPGTLFNDKLQICDWPSNVVVARPECTTQPEKTEDGCGPGERWSECAVRCSRSCSHYRHELELRGLCNKTSDCAAGCVPSDGALDCAAAGRYWRDPHTCVERADCSCRSEDGRLVAPGTIVKVSECKSCQCINDYYTCVEAGCETNEIRDVHNVTVVTERNRTKSQHLDTILIASIVTPPRGCAESNYVWLGELSPFEVSFVASSESPGFAAGQSARLRRVGGMLSWRPAHDEPGEWLEMRLDRPRPIYGLIVGGDPYADKFVTSYELVFSEDGQMFSRLLDEAGKERVLRGPVDAALPVQQMLSPPIEAKAVRVYPLTWHNGIAMQLELVGCDDAPKTTTTTAATPILTQHVIKPVCDDQMGYNMYIMSDRQVSVSSSSLNKIVPNLRLSATEIWRPLLDNPDQYVQFDFLEPRNLTGVETKGGNGIWTSAYKVYYSSDAKSWNPVIDENGVAKEFLGNVDDYSSHTNYFEIPIKARLLRIFPTKWHRHIGLKVEILGCFLPYPNVEPPPTIPPPPPAPPASCNVCNGVYVEDSERCKCERSLWWDGRFCVGKQECPCVVDHVTYAVGSSYEGSDCQQCLCSLGGASVCRAKVCEPCAQPGHRPVLGELCACLCKPCPTGARLCPTSGDCVDEARWCDGLQDCPDDEFGCSVRANTTTSLLERKIIEVQCQTSCPPGFVMEPESASGSYGIANYGYIKEKAESIKESYSKEVYMIKTPDPARIQSRFGDDSDDEHKCPKFICRPIIDNSIDMKECPIVVCPAGFMPKVDQSKSYRKNNVCDNTCIPIPPKERVCSIVGRTITTFDDFQYKYDICNHILVRDRRDQRWSVTAHKRCDQQLSCRTVLSVKFGEHVVSLDQNMSAIIDGQSYDAGLVKRLGEQHPAMKLARVGEALRLESRHHPFWAMLAADGCVTLGVSEELAGRVDGACGYFDGVPSNDPTTPEGLLAKSSQDFGDSWAELADSAECKLQVCPREMQAEAWKICSLVKDASFEGCAKALDRDKFASSCLENSCGCLSAGNSSSQECRCRALSSFVASCLAPDRSVDLSAWRSVHDCPAVCPAPFVHKDCFRNKCEMSCENLREAEPCPAMDGLCVPGCFCPDGLVRRGDSCVPPAECRDCVCEGLAGSRYVSFDRSSVPFDGNCTYLLSGSTVANGTNVYQVLVSNGACEAGTCRPDAISLSYQSHVVQIRRGDSPSELISLVDGYRIDKLPYKAWLYLEESPNRDLKLLVPGIQLELVVFKRNFAFALRLPSHTFAGAMNGLCGNCNGRQDDDFRMPNGQVAGDVQEFGNSWRVQNLPAWLGAQAGPQQCGGSAPPRKSCVPGANHQRCERLLLAGESAFARCHGLVDPRPYYLACRDSLCAGAGDGCASLEAYARMCAAEGVCLDWRTDELCPYRCPTHLEYRSCEPSCTGSCESVLGVPSDCPAGQLLEGCFCPGDQVWRNGSCVDRRQCQLCDAEGHADGDVWQPDRCTECTCRAPGLTECRQTSCPARETVCDENSRPALVTGTEHDCCPKYLCVPVAVTPAPYCLETQQPECGYAQVLKSSVDSNGCQKFICQCAPEEECPLYDIDVRSNVELEPGFVTVTNTSGCCPRTMTICKPELCPKPPACKPHYKPVVRENPNACCDQVECVPPKDVCLYYLQPNDFNFVDNLVAKKIGESWQDGKCKSCSCELQDGLPTPRCVTKDCLKMSSHPDYYDYVLRELPVDGQCCPDFERIACKHDGHVYQVGEVWDQYPEDACATASCALDANGVMAKRTLLQNCSQSCELGYEYRPPTDGRAACCGECAPVACIVAGELKNPGETWYSEDNCVASTCSMYNGSLHVHVAKETCEGVDPMDQLNYRMEEQRIPGKCCPRFVRTACIGDGRYYQPGESWKSQLDSCVVEACVPTADGGMLKQRETKTCSTECPRGWEYQQPIIGNCCGECKQVYCINDEYLYEPGKVWYSDDNCTTYSCVQTNDQLLVSKSSQVCPELNCAPEATYDDGCCRKCNPSVFNVVKQSCAAEVLDFKDTIGVIVENKGIHGMCTNVEYIDGLAECHGHCSSSTNFDRTTWNQVINCNCCQPVDYNKISVELMCADGHKYIKTLTVPTNCSCEKCSSEQRETGILKPIKKGIKNIFKKYRENSDK